MNDYIRLATVGSTTAPFGRRTTKNIWCNGPLTASEKQISQMERELSDIPAFPVRRPGRDKVVVIKSAAISAAFSLVTA